MFVGYINLSPVGSGGPNDKELLWALTKHYIPKKSPIRFPIYKKEDVTHGSIYNRLEGRV